MSLLAAIFEKCLELISVALLVTLAIVILVAVFFRYVLNDSLIWSDELAKILLVWITYFGAALAALRRAHLGFGSLVTALPRPLRVAAFVVAELTAYAVFITLAWAGWVVLAVMEGQYVETLPDLPWTVVKSIVPLGCALLVLAMIASTPLAWRRAVAGVDQEAEEIEAEIAKAQAELARAEARS